MDSGVFSKFVSFLGRPFFVLQSKRFKVSTSTGGSFHNSIFLIASTLHLQAGQFHCESPAKTSSSMYFLMAWPMSVMDSDIGRVK